MNFEKEKEFNTTYVCDFDKPVTFYTEDGKFSFEITVTRIKDVRDGEIHPGIKFRYEKFMP